MSGHNAIGVFDSGLGGLSVLQKIHHLLPSEDLIYVADSAHAPYGEKTPDYIRARCEQVATFLLNQPIKALVVACNTATVHAVDYLRELLPIPIIGIEPAIKPAALLTQTKTIGVLATQQTVNSPRLQRLIAHYAEGITVLPQACVGLVEHVEQGDFASPALHQLLHQYLKPLIQADADTLVLGCTHYPFLMQAIREHIPAHVHVLETSLPVTHQLIRVLQQYQLEADSAQQGSVRFYSSKDDFAHHYSMQCLWQWPLTVEVLPSLYR